MTTYLVTWEEVIVHGVHIEAESEAMAKAILEEGEYAWDRVEMLDSTGIVENSIMVEEVV
jgi:hypothetical protein